MTADQTAGSRESGRSANVTAAPGPLKAVDGVLGLEPALGRPGEHEAVHLDARSLPQRQQRAAAPDLDVVGVGPDGEHLQRSVGQLQVPHVVATSRGAGTGTGTGGSRRHSAHGLSPEAYRLSSEARSLSVSIGRQNPS